MLAKTFDIHVFAKSPAHIGAIAELRSWAHQSAERQSHVTVGLVQPIKSLEELTTNMAALTDADVLVVGAEELRNPALAAILDEAALPFHVVVMQSGGEPGGQQEIFSTERNLHFCHQVDLTRKIGEVIDVLSLKQDYSFEVLESRPQITEYLSMRFEIWCREGLLSEDRRPMRAPWEVDFADQFSVPVGCIDKLNQIVACGRMVREIGQYAHTQRDIIRDLLNEVQDPVLQANFSPPGYPRHPFDLLDEFEGFRDYYRQLFSTHTRMGEISRIIVHPDHRNRYLSLAIVEQLVSIAEDQGIMVLFLACRFELEALYKRIGFSTVRGVRSERFGEIQVPSILMERWLTAKPESE